MARRAVRRPPYDAALQLTWWAAQELPYLDGRLRLAGIDPDELDMRQWLNVAYAELVDLHGGGQASRAEAKKALDDKLAEPVALREAWGRGPQAEQGQRAMMALAGGPAPPRQPKE